MNTIADDSILLSLTLPLANDVPKLSGLHQAYTKIPDIYSTHRTICTLKHLEDGNIHIILLHALVGAKMPHYWIFRPVCIGIPQPRANARNSTNSYPSCVPRNTTNSCRAARPDIGQV
jgi:hypothetical protein